MQEKAALTQRQRRDRLDATMRLLDGGLLMWKSFVVEGTRGRWEAREHRERMRAAFLETFRVYTHAHAADLSIGLVARYQRGPSGMNLAAFLKAQRSWDDGSIEARMLAVALGETHIYLDNHRVQTIARLAQSKNEAFTVLVKQPLPKPEKATPLKSRVRNLAPREADALSRLYPHLLTLRDESAGSVAKAVMADARTACRFMVMAGRVGDRWASVNSHLVMPMQYMRLLIDHCVNNKALRNELLKERIGYACLDLADAMNAVLTPDEVPKMAQRIEAAHGLDLGLTRPEPQFLEVVFTNSLVGLTKD